MEAFAHDPIDLERPAFRLLQLLHGEGPVIECELFQAFLDGDDTIPYEALSYTWGGEEQPCTAVVNGKVLQITENLYAALEHLRSEYLDRIIWIDAICIDQRNLRERGHQVLQMSKVYSQAEEVIVWLGPATQETDDLMDTLVALEQHSIVHSRRNWNIEQWTTFCSLDPRRQSTNLKAGLDLLLGRPWWKRVWILQEIANAKKARVHSGFKSVKSRTFALAPTLLNVKPDQHCRAVLEIMPGRLREESWWCQNRTLNYLLLQFSESEAKDERDKIYALLGISSDAHDTERLRPDYTKSLEQAVHDTAMFLETKTNPTDCATMPDLLNLVRNLNLDTVADRLRFVNVNEAMNLLGMRGLEDISVKMMQGIVSNDDSAKILQLMPSFHGIGRLFTNEVAIVAAANRCSGFETMLFITQADGNQVYLTEEVAMVAAANEACGKEILDMFLDCTLFMDMVPWKVLEKAAKNELKGWDIIHRFVQHGLKLMVTQQVLQAAASNKTSGGRIFSVVIQDSIIEMNAPEELVLTAIANKRDGKQIVVHLLQYCGSQIAVTDRMLEASKRDAYSRSCLDLIHAFHKHSSINDQEAVLEFLLDQGANPYVRRGEYGEMLFIGAYYGLNRLLSKIFATGFKPYTLTGYPNVDRLVLEAGALELSSARIRLDLLYSNALNLACYQGHENIVKALLDRGADPTAQYWLCHVTRLSQYSSRPIFPNMAYFLQATSIYYAANLGHIQIVELLLAKMAKSSKPHWQLDTTKDLFPDRFWACHQCIPYAGSVNWEYFCRGCNHFPCQDCYRLTSTAANGQHCYRDQHNSHLRVNEKTLEIVRLMLAYCGDSSMTTKPMKSSTSSILQCHLDHSGTDGDSSDFSFFI